MFPSLRGAQAAPAGERKSMLALLKLVIGSLIAVCILNPGSTPSADTCECKARALAPKAPQVDTCECKAKAT
jgi:hypothetical protein